MKRSADGYIALLTVLIVGAVSLAIAVGLLLLGSNSSSMFLAEQQGAQARNLASACSEEGLEIVRDNNNFIGTANLTLGQGNCSYTVTKTTTTTRTISSTGTVNDIVRKNTVYVTIGASSISVTSWQEVP
jgi:hypothetical protein